MKFKISEISKMSGFSPSGIRFFEEAGVIKPTRGDNQKYREFSMDDLQMLLACKQYRECGIPLNQAVELLKNANPAQIRAQINSQALWLEKEITRKRLLLKHLEEISSAIQKIEQTEPVFERCTLPGLYYLKLWQPGYPEGEYAPHDSVFEWLEQSPITNSCLLLSTENLLRGSGELETAWGLCIEEDSAKLLGFSPAAQIKEIPAQECVRVLVNVTENLTIDSGQLTATRQYLKELSLHPTGPAVSTFILSVNDKNSQFNRYDYLWIPVH